MAEQGIGPSTPPKNTHPAMQFSERVNRRNVLANTTVGFALVGLNLLYPAAAQASEQYGSDQMPERADSRPVSWPWNPPTPTPTRTPVPTYTPTPTPTPHPTRTPTPTPEPTPIPRAIEIPLIGTDEQKPSEVARAIQLINAPNFREGPSTNTDAIPQVAGTIVYTTGYTTKQPDGIWDEVVEGNQILFVRNDVLRAKVHKATPQEKIQYALFADTPPLSSNQISVGNLTKGIGSMGGTKKESDRAKDLINTFWGGVDVNSNATTDSYNALQKRIAIAANGELGFIESGGMESYSYRDTDGNIHVVATTINGGFMVVTAQSNESGILEAKSISLDHWNNLVQKVGLKTARDITKHMTEIGLRIFKTTIDGNEVITSPDGYQSVDFYTQLTNDPLFDDGEPEPVVPQPTSTPTSISTSRPTNTSTPTSTPTPLVESGGEERTITEKNIEKLQKLSPKELKAIVEKALFLKDMDGETDLPLKILSTDQDTHQIVFSGISMPEYVWQDKVKDVFRNEKIIIDTTMVPVIIQDADKLRVAIVPFAKSGLTSIADLPTGSRLLSTSYIPEPNDYFINKLIQGEAREHVFVINTDAFKANIKQFDTARFRNLPASVVESLKKDQISREIFSKLFSAGLPDSGAEIIYSPVQIEINTSP